MARVSVSAVAGSIDSILARYASEVAADLDRAVEEAGKECAADLRKGSPKDTGKYARGWKCSVERGAAGDVRATVHNTAKPSLTHLLELGHAGPHPAPAHPHIGPASARAFADVERRLRHG